MISLTYKPLLYHNFIQSKAFPNLIGFEFTRFNQLGFELALNFENKLYVSSSSTPDLIDLRILMPNIFVGAETGDEL